MSGSDRRIVAMMFWALMRGILIVTCTGIKQETIKALEDDTIRVSHLIDKWVNGYTAYDGDYKGLVKKRDG